MSEIHFRVEALPGGGYLARAIGTDIFTEADQFADLHERVRDAVQCHFEAGAAPDLIRLHFAAAGAGDAYRRDE